MQPDRLETTVNPDATAIDSQELKRVLGCFATGVVVVTTLGPGDSPVGLTVDSFNSVSLDPPLVLWSLSLNAPSLTAFRTHNHFAVNILAEDHAHLCRQFAVSSHDKFKGVETVPGIGGVPLLQGVVAHLECRTFARYPGGDHEIYLGEVVSMRWEDRAPLVRHGGAFKRLVPLTPDDQGNESQ